MIDDHNECEWVNVSSGTGSLTRVVPDKIHRAVKRLCIVCVCVSSTFKDPGGPGDVVLIMVLTSMPQKPQ